MQFSIVLLEFSVICNFSFHWMIMQPPNQDGSRFYFLYSGPTTGTCFLPRDRLEILGNSGDEIAEVCLFIHLTLDIMYINNRNIRPQSGPSHTQLHSCLSTSSSKNPVRNGLLRWWRLCMAVWIPQNRIQSVNHSGRTVRVGLTVSQTMSISLLKYHSLQRSLMLSKQQILDNQWAGGKQNEESF